MYICMYVCVYICVYIYVYICTQTHTHTHVSRVFCNFTRYSVTKRATCHRDHQYMKILPDRRRCGPYVDVLFEVVAYYDWAPFELTLWDRVVFFNKSARELLRSDRVVFFNKSDLLRPIEVDRKNISRTGVLSLTIFISWDQKYQKS